MKLWCEVLLSDSLDDEDRLDQVSRVIAHTAPDWASRSFVRRGTWGAKRQLGPALAGFSEVVRDEAFKSGTTYDHLVSTYGPGEYERRSGDIEIRGSYTGVEMTLTLDEWIAIPLAGETQLGNRIDVTVTRTIAEGKPAAEWLIRLTEELTARLPVAWAAAHLVDEYDALNELPDGTIGGRNIGQSLPGLYWFNVFGDEYIDLLGRARLVTTPAYRVATIGSSIAIQLSRAPQDWKTDDYRSTHKEALRHLGSKYFFDKEHPARSTLAPQWKPPVSSPPKHTAQDPSLARHPPEGMD